MKAALLHEDHICWASTETNVYSLDEPYQGHAHIAVSRHEKGPHDTLGGVEIIGCDERGCIEGDSVVCLWRHDDELSFTDALTAIGYSVG